MISTIQFLQAEGWDIFLCVKSCLMTQALVEWWMEHGHSWKLQCLWEHLASSREPWRLVSVSHDVVIKWKHFPRNWPFVQGNNRSPVNSPHKSQRRRVLMFALIWAWINRWVNNCEAADLWPHRAHRDVIVMYPVRLKSLGNWLYSLQPMVPTPLQTTKTHTCYHQCAETVVGNFMLGKLNVVG